MPHMMLIKIQECEQFLPIYLTRHLNIQNSELSMNVMFGILPEERFFFLAKFEYITTFDKIHTRPRYKIIFNPDQPVNNLLWVCDRNEHLFDRQSCWLNEKTCK